MCFGNITISSSVFWRTHVSYFENLFESIHDYRKIVSLMFLFKTDVDLLHERGF